MPRFPGVPGSDGARRRAAAEYIPAQALLTAHYSVHAAFMGDGFTLLDAVGALRHIPCVAVHGANDLICPPATAYELHRAWPEMELRVVHGAGHSMYEDGLAAEVVRATDCFARRAREATAQPLPRETPRGG